jgi:cellulose biosynthesis protein BcsQ
MLLSRVGVEHAEHAHKTVPYLFEDALNAHAQNPMAYIVPRASDLVPINQPNALSYVSIVPSIPRLWFVQHDLDRSLYLAGDDPANRVAQILKLFLDQIAGSYHCVLFDCPPGFGTLTRAALRLADHIVAPTIADYTSMRSLQDFVTLGLIETLHLDVESRLHVVVSKYTGTNSQREALDILRASYPVREPAIPQRDHVQVVAERHATRARTYAQKYGRPVYAPLKSHVKGMSDCLYRAIFA